MNNLKIGAFSDITVEEFAKMIFHDIEMDSRNGVTALEYRAKRIQALPFDECASPSDGPHMKTMEQMDEEIALIESLFKKHSRRLDRISILHLTRYIVSIRDDLGIKFGSVLYFLKVEIFNGEIPKSGRAELLDFFMTHYTPPSKSSTG